MWIFGCGYMAKLLKSGKILMDRTHCGFILFQKNSASFLFTTKHRGFNFVLIDPWVLRSDRKVIFKTHTNSFNKFVYSITFIL